MEKLQEIKGYARDKKSRALVNMDKAAYKSFKQTRDSAVQVKHIQNQVNSLQGELKDIKNLLLQLVNGKNNG